MNHDWWWQRHDEDGNDDELQMNGLRNFDYVFDDEYDDLRVNVLGKFMTRMMINIRWLLMININMMTLKANGFGKGGLRRVATLHSPTPQVILIIFRLMQKTCPYNIIFWRLRVVQIIRLVSSGARLRRRKSSPRQEPPLVERDPKIRLSKQFREVLQDIYDRVDLDNSGSLSRAEFNLFNWRTSGEEVADEEWQVVEQNFRRKLYEQEFFLGDTLSGTLVE